jgi:hypothetical protein
MNNYQTFRLFVQALSVSLAPNKVLLALLLLAAVAVPSTASAQFFSPGQAPKVGDLPSPNAGVQAQYQGFFIKDWTKAGRVSPSQTNQASPFNPQPWGQQQSNGWR